MSQFLISCGGTGGHLSPGIALAEGLVSRGHQATLLISKKKVDARLIEKYPHLVFVRIPGAPFSLRPLGLVKFLWQQSHGLIFSVRLIRRSRPDAIVGFGGFTTAAIIVAGAVHRIPVALHEANRVPGRAIRLLGRFADRVYLPPGVRLSSVRFSATRHVGLPVRKEIVRMSRDFAREKLGIEGNHRLVVVLGGSQGASGLNNWARTHQESLAREGVQIFCVTGLGKGDATVVSLAGPSGQTVKSYYVPFTDQVAALLSAADLVVSRAGAGTIAELTRCETPAILVPYPHAADDHQWANARFFEQQGGGLVMDESVIGTLRQEVLDVVFNDWLLGKFRSNLQRMDRGNLLDVILRDLEELNLPPVKTEPVTEPAHRVA